VDQYFFLGGGYWSAYFRFSFSSENGTLFGMSLNPSTSNMNTDAEKKKRSSVFKI